MSNYSLCLITTFLIAMAPFSSTAQYSDFTAEFVDRFLIHFEQSSDKLLQLANEIPEELYEWSPDGEALPFATVFTHIARHNYTLPSSWLDVDIPDDIDIDGMEDILDNKEVIEILSRSVDHVKTHIPYVSEEQLMQPVTIFGDETKGWAALFLLIAHMNEHVGQAISYSRMNGIVPPWSR